MDLRQGIILSSVRMDVKIEVNYKVNIGKGKGWKEWTPESVGDYSAGVNHSLRKSLLPKGSRIMDGARVSVRC